MVIVIEISLQQCEVFYIKTDRASLRGRIGMTAITIRNEDGLDTSLIAHIHAIAQYNFWRFIIGFVLGTG
jgi:hypothetical protein